MLLYMVFQDARLPLESRFQNKSPVRCFEGSLPFFLFFKDFISADHAGEVHTCVWHLLSEQIDLFTDKIYSAQADF